MSAAVGLLNLEALGSGILNAFNGWDLQNANYNGVNFYIINKIGTVSNSLVNNAINTINGIESIFNSPIDPSLYPLNSSLPIDTNLFLKKVQDKISRKLIVHQNINSDYNTIEDMGFGPETFSIMGILSGNDYYQAYNLIYDYFLARRGDSTFANIPSNYQYVLTHPVRGRIPNTYLNDFKVVHSYSKFKAIIFNATFVSSTITSSTTTYNANYINTLSQNLSAVINGVNAVTSAVVESQLLLNSLVGLFSSQPQKQILKSTILPNITNSTIPLANATATLMYNNLSPNGFTNYYFKNQTIDYTVTPALVPYANGISINSINNLISVYQAQVEANITAINNLNYNATNPNQPYNYSVIFNDLIVALKAIYASILTLGESYAQTNKNAYFTYVVPYIMSIRLLCFLNKINFNDSSVLINIYNLNSSIIQDVNFIPAGSLIIIPVSLING